MASEPGILSPERIQLLPDIVATFDPDRGCIVTFTVRYEEWCCGEAHELSNAIAIVVETLESAADCARATRVKGERDAVSEALDDYATRRNDGVQLTLFDNI